MMIQRFERWPFGFCLVARAENSPGVTASCITQARALKAATFLMDTPNPK